ncbi:MAG: sigma 54-interacting transcriptional regulator, partial [Thermoanaerobaculia bacterium]
MESGTAALVPVLSEIARVASETLDLHVVFQRISAAAARVLAFDAMTVTYNREDEGFSLYTIAGPTLNDEERRAYARLVPRKEYSPTLWALLTRAGRTDDLFSFLDTSFPRDQSLKDAKIRSMLRVPLAGSSRGGYLSFLSLRPGAYTEDDEVLVRPIADVIAMAFEHERLAADEKERRRKYEGLQALAPALAKALDVRDVFERISEIARPVIPHDRMALGLLTEDRKAVRVYAVSGTGFPEIQEPIRLTTAELAREDWSTEIIRDVLVEVDPASDKCRHLALDGTRSLLRVPIFFEGHWQFAGGLLFLSRTANTYSEDDVPFAQHVADQVALALSHQRLAEEARRAAEARAQAEKLEKRVEALSEELASRGGFGRIVGTSKSWHDVLVQAAKVAPMETTVLLTGESGTGKEVVARAIHRSSARAAGPFIALNGAALPDQLLESELFGYEKGAFTGATGGKPGRLEQAGGGTLF